MGIPFAEIETAWAKEVEERVAAFDRGETQTCVAEDVFAEARRLATPPSEFKRWSPSD
jgi:hypothetical protein